MIDENIHFISIEHDYQNSAVRIWCNVDGQDWCVHTSTMTGERTMLDSEGYPVYPRNSREEAVWQRLLQHVYGG
jgi:glycine cleavage system aminomethyltransferase T